jgi:hypothetical protein
MEEGWRWGADEGIEGGREGERERVCGWVGVCKLINIALKALILFPEKDINCVYS